MRLVLHRRIRSDVDEIMDYYECAEHPELADDFYRELRQFMLAAAAGLFEITFTKPTSGEPI